LEKSEKPKNPTAKDRSIQGVPISVRGCHHICCIKHYYNSVPLPDKSISENREAYLVWSKSNRCHKLTEPYNEETQQENQKDCQVHRTRMCWRERGKECQMKKMKEEKYRRIFSGAKGSFFKTINVVKVVLFNKEETRISKQLTVRLCRCIR
jgi:hypothetical protein